MDNSNNTESSQKSVKALLPLLLLYLFASGTVFDKISIIGGSIMIALGLIIALYIYLKHKDSAK